MTRTVQLLIEELESLPKEQQEERAASYLKDLRDRKEKVKQQTDPYTSFDVLREAELPGPEDASETYEEKLYGRAGADGI